MPAEKAWVSPLSGAALFGEGLFESVPVYAGRPLFLRDHLERLQKGCEFLDWSAPSEAEFQKVIGLFHRVHPSNFIIRFNLTQSFAMPVHPRSRGGRPELWAFIRPLAHQPESFWPAWKAVGVSSWTVPDSQSAPNHFKWAFYMMTRKAYRQHPEWKEMVRVNRAGYAVDGGGSSVLWFDGRKALIPPRSWVGLEGITQKKITALCRRLGIPVIEKPWRPLETLRRGELIFTGSGVGVMGASHLAGKRFQSTPRLALRLWQYYRDWTRFSSF